MRPDHELGHADVGGVVAGAEDQRLDPVGGGRDLVQVDGSPGRSRSGPRCRSGGRSRARSRAASAGDRRSAAVPASSTLGIMMQSRFAPAPPTTSIDVAQAPLGGDAVDAHDPGLAAVVVRAERRRRRSPATASFSSGETASSRSRNTWSAGSVAALASIFSDEPGTARQERRSRTGLPSARASVYLRVRRWQPQSRLEHADAARAASSGRGRCRSCRRAARGPRRASRRRCARLSPSIR